MIELISKDVKYCRKCFVTQSRRVDDAWHMYVGMYVCMYAHVYCMYKYDNLKVGVNHGIFHVYHF